MTAGLLALFGVCSCGALTACPGVPCESCVATAREYIRRTDGAPATDAELASLLSSGMDAAGPDETEPGAIPPADPAHPPGQASAEWRANQLCWVCEQRRKCHPDPDFADGAGKRWICKDCEAIS